MKLTSNYIINSTISLKFKIAFFYNIIGQKTNEEKDNKGKEEEKIEDTGGEGYYLILHNNNILKNSFYIQHRRERN